jgi:hypothetical protein
MLRMLSLTTAVLLASTALPAQEAPPLAIPVAAAPALGTTNAGRLLVFAKAIAPGAKPEEALDVSPFSPNATYVAAREVTDLRPGTPALVDTGTDAYPAAFSTLPPGTYQVQALLDRDHSYAYGGREAGDLLSKVVTVTLPGPIPTLVLDHVEPEADEAAMLARLPADRRKTIEAALTRIEPVEVHSPVLTRFWGRPTSIKGWVALPPGYAEGKASYPTVYSDGGFGSTLGSARLSAASMTGMMAKGDVPPMIWVYLDHHIATGTHEFADSANNGPVGQALVEEVIPALEQRYWMDARPSGRFLTGHSSGGWSTLWLQVAYPKVFGGSWPTAPDPADFHDFTNANLYDDANFYAGADGKDHPLVRKDGKVVATLRQFGRLEQVLGPYGGQFASFEWVFSPKGVDGRPMPVFDRATGAIDKQVVAYWRDHYDVAHIVARDWQTLKPDLDGKIHLTVGTADTFYLDGPAHRLKAVLDGLGARSSFRFVPGKDHGNLYEADGDRSALTKQIAREMYAVARPARAAR